MNDHLNGLPRALLMALSWAAAWAVVGMGIEITEPGPSFIDGWVTALAIPGFVTGLSFGALLQLAGQGRRLGAVSLPRVGICSVLAGVLVGTVVVALGFPHPAAVIGTIASLSVATALGAMVLSRFMALPKLVN
jgi:hypothetical protein